MIKLVIGRGHLGHFLRDAWNVSYEHYWTYDIADISDKVLSNIKPDVVINAAGKTDLKWCEENVQKCFEANTTKPFQLYQRCANHGIPFIHLSSGCVWDGPYNSQNKPFTPQDPVSPACIYAWTKVACDALMLQNEGDVVIVRPRQVYSPIKSPRNTINKLCAYPKLLDTDNSMTSASTVVKTIDAVIGAKCWGRIVCCYDKGVSSPFRVSKLLADAGLRQQPQLLQKSDLDQWHKPKRVDTVLYDAFFEDLVDPPNVEDELKGVIAEYTKQ